MVTSNTDILPDPQTIASRFASLNNLHNETKQYHAGLIPAKSGDVRNPYGIKGAGANTLLKEIELGLTCITNGRTRAERIAETLLNKAEGGNIRAVDLMMSYLHPKAQTEQQETNITINVITGIPRPVNLGWTPENVQPKQVSISQCDDTGQKEDVPRLENGQKDINSTTIEDNNK